MSLILNGTTGLSDVDGSASTPAIRGTDTNTGIFFPAADTIAFAEGGAEVARFDADGDLGIATTNPLEKLDVRSANASFGSTSGTDGNIYIQSGYDAGIRYLTRLRTDYNGFFSISTGSGSNSVAPSSNTVTERMRIDSSGRLLVAKTSTTGSANLQVAVTPAGNPAINIAATTTGTAYAMLFYTSDGVDHGYISYTTSGTSYNTTSDYRLKENIAPMTGALAKVAQLKPCTYTWKATGDSGQGFIAHELAEVVPDAVTGEKDEVDADGNPRHQGIDTSFLVATLTAAIQEQQAMIQSQAETITALEARLTALEQA